MNNKSKTDWARIGSMSDKNMNTSDIPPLSEEFFARAQLRMPQSAISDYSRMVTRIRKRLSRSAGTR